MATTKITNPDLFDLGSLDTALKLPSGTTAERPTSPSTGEWRYNTTTNLVEFYDGGAWRDLQSEDIPPTPSENFNVVVYTGNGATQSITGVGFKPDWLAIKERDATNSWRVFDSTRGLTSPQTLFFNLNFAEDSESNTVSSFDADGFTMGSQQAVNDNGNTYVAYCWKANGGTTSSNTDGSITSTVQANTKAGFSIVTYTGTGSTGTYGHGLSSAPDFIITKKISSAESWIVWSSSLSASNYMYLNGTGAVGTDTNAYKTIGATTNEIGSDGTVNTSGQTYVAYCFRNVAGYSKIGTYTGNGTTQVVNTGFQPKWILIKSTVGNDNWRMYDTTRGINAGFLEPNNSDVENTGDAPNLLILSTGFEITAGGTTQGNNANGNLYTYYAFAADSSAAPVLADSFANKLYTGTGSAKSISGLGFSPSFVWIKGRTNAASHQLFDTLRGATYQISSDNTSNQTQNTQMLTSFDTDGFSLGNQSSVNGSGVNYVAWNWKANAVPTINTDGGIQSIVSANQASGFSIVKWDGTGSASTVGHGLSAAPELILTKRLNGSGDWYSFSVFANGGTTPANYFLKLNSSDAEILNTGSPPSVFAGTVPTATVFSVGTTLSGSSSDSYIAYCFHSVSGYSKIGSYAGTGAAGNNITIGFEPSWILIKRSNSTAGWLMFDNKRNPTNPRNSRLEANNSQAEQAGSTSKFVDFDATSFEPQISDSEINASGGTYLYMAFKENPAQPAIPSGKMAYLVVAGGGSGHRSDSNNGAGGGGAGGLRSSYVRTGGGGTVESNITLTAKTYTITIGAGGADNSTPAGPAISGSDSVLDTITSVGGGGGGGVGLPAEASTSGGSGGGGAGYNSSAGAAGTANQGFAGGNGSPSTSGTFSERNGGGGGGAGAVGTTGSTSSAGPGGFGVTVPITGTNVGYAGGGSGGNKAGSGIPSTSGGGTGAGTNGIGTSGTANTGGGGGGGGVSSFAGKGGGSGVVILRMNTSDYSGSTTGSPTVTTSGSETILTYTGSGTYVHS